MSLLSYSYYIKKEHTAGVKPNLLMPLLVKSLLDSFYNEHSNCITALLFRIVALINIKSDKLWNMPLNP